MDISNFVNNSESVYIYQLLDEENQERSHAFCGTPTEIIELFKNPVVIEHELKADFDKTTVLILTVDNDYSRLPLYSLTTFLEILTIASNRSQENVTN